LSGSLDINTMFKIRGWERYRFLIDFEHHQVIDVTISIDNVQMDQGLTKGFEQHKAILERTLPDNLKLAIAKRIENNLFGKVQTDHCCQY
jgi:hypothetical protein